MFSPPTDRLHKFAAIGGLAIALGGGTGALRQYNGTGLQEAEYFGTVAKVGSVYERFATQAREQISRNEKLGSTALTSTERASLEAQPQKFREAMPSFDKEFLEAQANAQRQEAITRHYRRMQAIWLLLAGVAVGVGALISYRGFKAWFATSANEA